VSVLYVDATRASVVYHVEAVLTRSRLLFPNRRHKVEMNVRRQAELMPMAIPMTECECS
jgi:hypothetical protein